MIRFAKELNLGLSAAERAVNRGGNLTADQAEAVRNFGKEKSRRILVMWPIASIVAVGAVVAKTLAEGNSLDITVLYALGAVLVVLGFTLLLFLGPQIWFLYFRTANRGVVASFKGRARIGPTTSKGTNVRFGSRRSAFQWRLPTDAADAIVDGADYTLYRNGDVLHWFERAE